MESKRSKTHPAHFSLDKKPHKNSQNSQCNQNTTTTTTTKNTKQHKTEKTRDADYGGRSSSRSVPWSQCSHSLWGTRWTPKWKNQETTCRNVIPITRTLFPSLVHNDEVAAQHWLMILVAGGHVNVSCCKAKKRRPLVSATRAGLVDVANCDWLKNSGRFLIIS